MARTAKTTLSIYDHGVLLAEASILDFTGTGVSSSFDGINKVTETITGGGSTAIPIFGEVVGGSGTTFTLAHVPSGTINLSANGQVLLIGAGNDYTISGAVITTSSSWALGSVIASYQY